MSTAVTMSHTRCIRDTSIIIIGILNNVLDYMPVNVDIILISGSKITLLSF